MKYAIMGGTFNPIHTGHIQAAHAALDSGYFDGVWFMPSGNPPHKSEDQLISKEHRYRMVQLSIEDEPLFHLSDLEMNREGHVYSVDTFDILKSNRPDDKFYLIIGTDSLLDLEKWYDYKRLLTNCSFVVVDRGGYDSEILKGKIKYYSDNYGTDILKISMTRIELSSSQIRDKIRSGASIDAMTPAKVIDYINLHNLYR